MRPAPRANATVGRRLGVLMWTLLSEAGKGTRRLTPATPTRVACNSAASAVANRWLVRVWKRSSLATHPGGAC
jgi:hypothetical protein